MRYLLIFLCLPLRFFAQGSTHNQEKNYYSDHQLDSVTYNYYESYDKLFPLLSEDKRYTDQLENEISQPHRDQEKSLYVVTLRKLKNIDVRSLSETALINYETLQSLVKRRLKRLQYEWYLLPESSFGPYTVLSGFMINGSGNRYVTFATVGDYENFIKRINIFTSVCDTVICYMRLGIKKKITQPRRMMEIVAADLLRATDSDLAKNPFYQPVLKMPSSFSVADRDRIDSLYKSAIQKTIIPTYRKFIDFLRSEYIPSCRETVGICAYPWGKAAYQDIISDYYGEQLTPGALLKKVRKYDKEYEDDIKKLIREKGLAITIDSFYHSFPADSFRIFKTRQDILDRYQAISQQVAVNLPGYFSHIPVSPVEIMEEPGFNRSLGARFTSGSEDGQRPDRIYISISDPATAEYTVLPSGFLHEGNPGHRFAFATAKTFITSPATRLISQHESFDAFDEGWAIYAESLGNELGVYADPYVYATYLKKEYNGSFIDRLENGINVDGWSYEQAMDSCISHGWNKNAADQVIFRFVSMPGQSHAYPLGYFKITELRDLAKKELGEKFDIKEFHWQVLKDGSVPLEVLDKKIRLWIKKEKQKAS